MRYPVMINEADLQEYGNTVIDDKTEEKKVFYLAHAIIYDFVIFSSLRSWRKKVIEQYRGQVEAELKEAIVLTAVSIYESGNTTALYDGIERLDGGSIEFKDLQERMTSIVPPIVWNILFSIEPSLLFNGGEI